MNTRTITLDLTDLQIELLRRWIDEAPHNPYAPMIAGVLPQLPLDTDTEACDRYIASVRRHRSAAAPSSADSSPEAALGPQSSGGFQLRACTDKGRKMLPDVLRRLLIDSLPHGESL